MDDGFDAGDGVPAGAQDARRWRRYSAQAARRIVARTAAGETLAGVCRDPQMPSARVVRGWLAKRPEFAAAMREARAVAGAPLAGRRSSYCLATAGAIVRRLCEGEAMRAILAGADMPAYSTVYRWLKDEPDFAQAVALARRIQADRLAELGWEMALSGTRETAYLTEVRLKHLRWYAGKLEPRKYGGFRPFDVDPEDRDENGRRRVDVLFRHFEIEVGEDGVKRVVSWSPNPETGEAEREAPPAEAAAGPRRWRPPVKTPVVPKTASAAGPEPAAEAEDYWRPAVVTRPDEDWL